MNNLKTRKVFLKSEKNEIVKQEKKLKRKRKEHKIKNIKKEKQKDKN